VENPGGIISSALTRWEANPARAVFGRARGFAPGRKPDYFEAQTQAIDSYIKRARAGHR